MKTIAIVATGGTIAGTGKKGKTAVTVTDKNQEKQHQQMYMY